MLCVNTNFAIDHFVLKITWITERQSYENTLSLVKSAWIWTIQRKFISHFSIGSKAARDKVNQIAHVQKSPGSLGTTNMAANREWASAFGSKAFKAFFYQHKDSVHLTTIMQRFSLVSNLGTIIFMFKCDVIMLKLLHWWFAVEP